MLYFCRNQWKQSKPITNVCDNYETMKWPVYGSTQIREILVEATDNGLGYKINSVQIRSFLLQNVLKNSL